MDELSIVRVVKLNIPNLHVDGTEGVKRPPRVGDVGTLVHKAGDLHIVECVDENGLTIWLADFAEYELEKVEVFDGVFRVNNGRKTMDERISYITTEMREIAEDATASFGNLTDEQLNWKPAPESWSVGQCLEHLIKTNEQFYPEMDKLAAGARTNSFWENWSPFTGFFGRFLVKAVTEDSKKAKAPSKDIVPPSDIASDVIERFTANISVVNEKVTACAAADREKTIITSPFLAVMTYKLDDAYSVLVEHTKRHIRQAKRVMETDGFPK